MDGGWDTGTWDGATWDYVSPIVVIDTHDGKKLKALFDKALSDKKRRRDKILEAYEIVFEGRPAVAEKIAEPFVVSATAAQPVKTIDLERLLKDVNAIEIIMRESQDIDDEEALTLLW
jgi:hypothetical protein